jgi:hypothetical protein
MLWVIGPSNLTLSALSTGSGVALSTMHTRPARGAATFRVLEFVGLCVGARVSPEAVCGSALNHIAADPPSLTARSFRVCHESEVFHGYEPDRGQDLLAYAQTLVVASGSTSSTSSGSGARIHVVQAEPHRPPLTHVLMLRSSLVS